MNIVDCHCRCHLRSEQTQFGPSPPATNDLMQQHGVKDPSSLVYMRWIFSDGECQGCVDYYGCFRRRKTRSSAGSQQ